MSISFYTGPINENNFDDTELKKVDKALKSGVATLNTEVSSMKTKVQSLENEKISADGLISMADDLDMGNNAIIGIEDINALNSVPSKKYVQDEDEKLNTKISKNISDITSLKSFPHFSHIGNFLYQNPIANVYKEPFVYPAGFLSPKFPLSSFYNDKTKLTLHFLACDNDTTLSTSSVIFSVEGIFYSKTGGFNSKVFVSGKEIISYRNGGNNDFSFGDDLSFVMKNLHSSYNSWSSFQLKIAVSWVGNETSLSFSVDYY